MQVLAFPVEYHGSTENLSGHQVGEVFLMDAQSFNEALTIGLVHGMIAANKVGAQFLLLQSHEVVEKQPRFVEITE